MKTIRELRDLLKSTATGERRWLRRLGDLDYRLYADDTDTCIQDMGAIEAELELVAQARDIAADLLHLLLVQGANEGNSDAAPEGWEWCVGAWHNVKSGDAVVQHLSWREWRRRVGAHETPKAYPNALEAMEAADASYAKAQALQGVVPEGWERSTADGKYWLRLATGEVVGRDSGWYVQFPGEGETAEERRANTVRHYGLHNEYEALAWAEHIRKVRASHG